MRAMPWVSNSRAKIHSTGSLLPTWKATRRAYGSLAAYSTVASSGTVERPGTTSRRASSAEMVVLLFIAIPSDVGPRGARAFRWDFALPTDVPAIHYA